MSKKNRSGVAAIGVLLAVVALNIASVTPSINPHWDELGEADLIDRYNRALDRLDLVEAERISLLVSRLYPGPPNNGEKLLRECTKIREFYYSGKSMQQLQQSSTRCIIGCKN